MRAVGDGLGDALTVRLPPRGGSRKAGGGECARIKNIKF